jgi:hypothetical protein
MGLAGILAGTNKSHRPGAEEWRQIIDGRRPSGLTVAAYCRDRGIADGTFYAGKRRLRSPAKLSRSSSPAFVEANPDRPELHGSEE